MNENGKGLKYTATPRRLAMAYQQSWCNGATHFKVIESDCHHS
jgi:hypothetical protein